MTELAQLRAVAEAATPGPWTPDGRAVTDARGNDVCFVFVTPTFHEGNAEHIATFDPPTVLKMIAVIEAAAEAMRLDFTGRHFTAQEPFITALRSALAALEA